MSKSQIDKIKVIMDQALASISKFSGEMFDLTVPSMNNPFGFDHIKGIINYGINFPISKFIAELKMILQTSHDDKSDKRESRLQFLELCNKSPEVRLFFSSFCNYLNGGGGNSKTPHTYSKMRQYDKNLMIITAAGGNIIILFAQLIVNIIDCFIAIVNNKTATTQVSIDNWDISDPSYEPSTLKEPKGQELVEEMLKLGSLEDDSSEHFIVIKETLLIVTPTIKLIFEKGLRDSVEMLPKNQEFFKIVKYFIALKLKNPEQLDIVYSIAKSHISDFDFKLSPNIYQSSIMGDFTKEQFKSFFEKLETDLQSLEGTEYDAAGFLLLRVKTLIDCSDDVAKQKYNSKQLNDFRKECFRVKGLPKVLYPQIMKEEYLSINGISANCQIYLEHLLIKKLNIKQSTHDIIDEIMKFYQVGYAKQANPLGDMVALVSPAQNSSEAVINYITTITYIMNIYIEKWQSLHKDGAPILKSGAPALKKLYEKAPSVLSTITYDKVCSNFLSLSNILYSDNGLLTHLGSDIINYFLNNPEFHTEQILDNLKTSFNTKRSALLGREDSNCVMLPSDLLLVPTNKNFARSLANIKDIMTDIQYSAFGFPDGVRVTINAIETKDESGDTNLDVVESNALSSAETDIIDYTHLPESSTPTSAEGTKSKTRKQRKQRRQRKRTRQRRHRKQRRRITQRRQRSQRSQRSQKKQRKSFKKSIV
jgi:hypothetical protein